MRSILNLAGMFVFLGVMAGNLSAQESGKLSAKALVAELEHVTTVLKGVVDVESAKAAEERLRQFRNSPFSSQDPEIRQQVQQLLDEDENLGQAFFRNQEQFQRIQGLGDDVFSIVIESLTGEKPISLVDQIERTAAILNQINNQQDLDRLGQELHEAWKPIAEMIKADPEATMDLFTNDPALRSVMEKHQAAVDRLDQSDPEFAVKVGKVMMGEELFRDLQEQSVSKLNNARVRLALSKLMAAILHYEGEMNAFPLPPKNEGEDLITFADAAFTDILTGANKKVNTKGIEFLDAAVMDDGGAVSDPWGKPFRVIMDTNRDQKITLPREYGDKVVGGRIFIDSAGPDGDFKTIEDNFHTNQAE